MIEQLYDISIISLLSGTFGAAISLSTKYGVKEIYKRIEGKREKKEKYQKKILKKVYGPIVEVLDEVYMLEGTAQELPREHVYKILSILEKESILIQIDEKLMDFKYEIQDWYQNSSDELYKLDKAGYLAYINNKFDYLCRRNAGKYLL